ncbi:GNAT family N-acetyltransferase [Streptomyces noursei]|uniref:GNAT family N-acetyltransferase n=1 Tax=Streptomyces noursei TaxID=1971 RepID=UPI00381A6F6F
MKAPGSLLPRRRTTPVTLFTGADALTYLATQWPLLYAQSPLAAPYQDPAWLRGWAAARPPGAEPLIAVADSPDGPAALALLHHADQHTIVPLGSPTAEYIRPVGPGAEHPAATTALVRHLDRWAADGLRVTLADVPATSSLGRHLATREHTAVHCAHVPLPVQFGAMSSSTRRTHVRRERSWTQLETAGRVTFARTTTVDALTLAVSQTIDLHHRRWAGHPAHDPPPEALPDVLARCGPRVASVAQLRLDEHLVASMVLLHRGTTCHSLLPAMDPAAADRAPGHALIRRVAASLAHSGGEVLDLGRTRPDPAAREYKASYGARWTTSLTSTLRPSPPRRAQ